MLILSVFQITTFSDADLEIECFENRNEGYGGIYNNTQMGSGVGSAGAMPETLLPFPQSLISDSVPMKITAMKSDNSGVTYYVHANPRKRYRDSVNDQILNTSNLPNKANNNNNNLSDIPLLIHQHQLEIQHIVSQHVSLSITLFYLYLVEIT